MSESTQDPEQEPGEPEVGLIADDQLPEDLKPTEDNPLAQDPSESDDDGDDGDDPGQVEGMPDMGQPGP
jgi:hypothetical protein